MIKPKKGKVFSENRAKSIKPCKANKETIVFSFAHICTDKNHNFECFKYNKKNSKMAETICALYNKLSELSSLTWDKLNEIDRKHGKEYLPVREFDKTFINSLDYCLTGEDKLLVIRFGAQKYRLILKRGTKCGRVAQILGIDLNLDLYSHT